MMEKNQNKEKEKNKKDKKIHNVQSKHEQDPFFNYRFCENTKLITF